MRRKSLRMCRAFCGPPEAPAHAEEGSAHVQEASANAQEVCFGVRKGGSGIGGPCADAVGGSAIPRETSANAPKTGLHKLL